VVGAVRNLQDPSVDDLQTRHAAYWNMESVRAPVSAGDSIGRHSRLGMYYRDDMPVEGPFEPEMVRTEEVVNHFRRWFERDGILFGDTFNVALPSSTIPWMEAIVGCSIFYSFEHDTMWAESPRDVVWPPPRLDLEANPWMQKLLELSVAFDEAFHGEFPVGTLHLRGATDLLGAYAGTSRVCMAAYDDPDSLRAAVDVVADALVGVVQRQMDAIRPYRDGYFSFWEMWTPGTTTTWSEDLSTLFSPEMYREFFLPFDEEMASRFDYPVLHVHTGEAHCFRMWGEIDGLILEVTTDPTGPTLQEVMPLLIELQEHMPLMVQVQSDEEMALTLATLSPRGLEVAGRRKPGRPSILEDLRGPGRSGGI